MEKVLNKSRDPSRLKISVVVPVYNAANILKQCLESLKNQTDLNYEAILVDDGSIDNSLQICRESGFKTLSLVVNKGQSVARNEGVKAATGEIIAFVDSDIVVSPEWLERYRKLLSMYADADMICGGYNGSIVDTEPALFALCEASYRRLNIPFCISSGTSSNCVIYREAFEEVGGYPEYYINAEKDWAKQKAVAVNEDAELGYLLSERGKKIIWSHDNPVKHYFRDTWKGYLKQQISFSRYALLSVFKFPKMLYNRDIYNKGKIMPEITIILIMFLSIFGIFFGEKWLIPTILICISALSFFYILHRNFFYYLKTNMKNYSFFRLFFWLIISRLCWVYGLILGLGNGCYMLWNNRFKQDTRK